MLREIQAHLESIYRIRAPDVENFRINREQLIHVTGDSLRDAEEWVLVRETDDGLDIAVFVDECHLDALSETSCISQAPLEAFAAFCAATEGVSHFLMLFERYRRQEPVRMLELEAQAEVDKFVCASLHQPGHSSEWWTRLFRDASVVGGLGAEESDRYEEAGRLAAGFCSALDEHLTVASWLYELRSFWRASGAQRLETMRKMAG